MFTSKDRKTAINRCEEIKNNYIIHRLEQHDQDMAN